MSTLRKVILFVTIYGSLRESVCSRSEKHNHLGSRTPYRFLQNNDNAPIYYAGCEAKKIWMFARHGTRLPDKDVINDMQTVLYSLRNEIIRNYEAGKSSLNVDVISNFMTWENNLRPKDHEILTDAGEEEWSLLGKRMRSRFPSVISRNYDNETYEFRSTPKQRTKESARHFAAGIFGKKEAKKVWYTPTYKWDPVLRFYKVCDAYQKQVKENPEALHEHKLYADSERMSAALKKVSDFLGLDRVLTVDEGNLVYQTCGFETAWENSADSPWCDVFDKDFAKVMEYYEDLKYYWVDGYGYPITYLPACVTVQDLFEHLRDDTKQPASFLFSHSGAMLKLLAHFGISKPSEPLKHSNEDENRPWRASAIDAFASNLAFVLYKCKDENRVLTLLQERIIRLPSCEEDLCPMKVLLQEYKDSINDCNFNEMCSISR